MKDPEQKRRGRPPVPEHRKRVKPNISLAPELIEAAKKKAEELSMGFSEFVTLALEREVAREMGITLPPIPKPVEAGKVVSMPSRSHIIAAAGSPIGAEVEDWDGENNTVLVRINGLSMVPLFNDQDVIPMHHKRGARSQFMKKGLIYLVEYEGGYTVKEYNRRAAKADEQGEEWVEDGKVRVLKSRNSEFPEIIIKGPVEWIAWFDPKVDRV